MPNTPFMKGFGASQQAQRMPQASDLPKGPSLGPVLGHSLLKPSWSGRKGHPFARAREYTMMKNPTAWLYAWTVITVPRSTVPKL